MYVCMYVYVTFWAPRGAHAQRANVTGSIKGLKVTVNCISYYSSAMLLLMKSLGLLVAALVRHVRRTADYSALRRQLTPCTGDLCVPVSGELVIHIRYVQHLLGRLYYFTARGFSLRIRISSNIHVST